MLNAAKGKTDSLSRWALAAQERRGYWKAVVAIAAKNARMAGPLGGTHPVFAMLYKLSQGLGMAQQIDLALR